MNTPNSASVSYTDIDQPDYLVSGHNIDADPKYADAGNNDLHILESSPCVGAGTASGAPPTDYSGYSWGTTVSMGAYSPIGFTVAAPSTAAGGRAFGYTVTARAADNVTVISNYAGTVHFTSSDGSATLPSDSALTNGTGEFEATLHALGGQTISATDTSTTAYTGTSGGITVSGPATHFVVTAPSTMTSNTSHAVTVTAEDADGNTAIGYAGTVHLTSSDPGFANATGNAMLTNGVGSFNVVLKKAGLQTIAATDSAHSSITGTSSEITVDPGAAERLAVNGPATATARVSASIAVTALDLYGNTVTGYTGTVHFSSTDAQATLPGSSELAGGSKTFAALLKTAGNQTVTATDLSHPSITGTSTAIDVKPSGIAALKLSTPSTAIGGNSVNVSVTALDQFGNLATGFAGEVSLASGDVHATMPTHVTLDDGAAFFTVVFGTPGTQNLTAKDTADPAIGVKSTVTVANAVLHTFAAGLQMISAPEDYTGLPMSSYLSPSVKSVATWEVSLDEYAVSPAAATDAIRPGVGYWVDFTTSTQLLNKGVPTNPATPVTISLSTGWNMIGDPFGTPVSMATGVTVDTRDANGISFPTAAMSGIVSPTLHTLSAAATGYSDDTTTLQPYAGYWVYAYMPCTLTMSGG